MLLLLPEEIPVHATLHREQIDGGYTSSERFLIDPFHLERAIPGKVNLHPHARDLWVSEIEMYVLNSGVTICHYLSFSSIFNARFCQCAGVARATVCHIPRVSQNILRSPISSEERQRRSPRA